MPNIVALVYTSSWLVHWIARSWNPQTWKWVIWQGTATIFSSTIASEPEEKSNTLADRWKQRLGCFSELRSVDHYFCSAAKRTELNSHERVAQPRLRFCFPSPY
jgi:hypothetical protein